MYKIYHKDSILHSLHSENVIANATLTTKLNAADEFAFSVFYNHPLYFEIFPSTFFDVKIYKGGVFLSACRITKVEESIQGEKKVSCEGLLAMLNDIVIRPYDTSKNTAPSSPGELFKWYISQYNAKAKPEQRIAIRRNDADNLSFASSYRASSQYPTVGSEILEKIIVPLGGQVVCDYSEAGTFIDFIVNDNKKIKNTFSYGQNLISYSSNISFSDYYNTIVPTGKAESDEDALTIEEFPDKIYNTFFIKNGDNIGIISEQNKYGIVEKNVSFSATNISDLMSQAFRYLEQMSIFETVSANSFLSDNKTFILGDYAKINISPLNIEKIIQCTQITYNVNAPENDKLLFGSAAKLLTEQI